MTKRFARISMFAGLLLIVPFAWAIANNDNTRPAGGLDGDELTLRMVVGVGAWRPEGPGGPELHVAAFGEEGGELSAPGPLIRVMQGTTVTLQLRNALQVSLRVEGMCSRPGKCDAIAIPAGATRDARFKLDAPGTYAYWASTTSTTLRGRARFDGQLGGAIIVDARDSGSRDRVFVISSHDDPPPSIDDPRTFAPAATAGTRVFAINGASWPHTEKLVYGTAHAVRWRIVNLSNIGHAMHLHGFHFDLQSTGDGTVDRVLPPDLRRTEVTEFVGPGHTFAMAWTPTRAGNWLFHCHMVEHMTKSGPHLGSHDQDSAGMTGLVMGVQVVGPAAPTWTPAAVARHLRLVLREEPGRYEGRSGIAVALEGPDATAADGGPGPILVLQRGEPVEIDVVNRLSEPTAIHWHGIELESYYDGVPGYGGDASRTTPAILPGTSFVARFTPPRAGTFIYHTHWHDEAQLAGGLYGALVVLEPGQRYDPAVDHVVVIGLNGMLVDGRREPFALNGLDPPAAIPMRAGVSNRIRLINITPNNSILTAFLVDRFAPTTWTPIAKDGAPLPSGEAKPRMARQLISVGETYDFEFAPTPGQDLWLEVRRGNGEWVLQAPVVLR